MPNWGQYEQFLEQESYDRARSQTEAVRRRQDSLTRHTPLLRTLFSDFSEYYETILASRGYSIVPKKRDDPTAELDRGNDGDEQYLYRLNILHPTDQWPERSVNQFEAGFLEGGKITRFDWHRNVALQYSVGLFSPWDEAHKQYSNDLTPRIRIDVWGQVPKSAGSIRQPDDYRFFQGYDNSFYHPYTYFQIEPQVNDSVELTKEMVGKVLFEVTPFVLPKER